MSEYTKERSFNRIKTNILVTLNLADEERAFYGLEGTYFKNAKIANLGGGGMCIELAEQLDIGGIYIVDFTLDFSNSQERTRLMGKVVWGGKTVVKRPAEYEYRYGVEFQSIDPGKRDAIVKFVTELENRQDDE